MRLSIWQQFGSNHSADFSIIGIFNSESAARRVADELQQALRTIEEWVDGHVSEATYLRDWGSELAPPEKELQQHYGVEWPVSSLDWLLTAHEQGRVRDAIVSIDNLVLMSNTAGTWTAGIPWVELMGKLADEVHVQSEALQKNYTIHMDFSAPDQATADDIEKALLQDYYLKVVPWLSYYGGRLSEPPDKLVREAQESIEWQKRYFEAHRREQNNEELRQLHQLISPKNTAEENRRIYDKIEDLQRRLGLVSVVDSEFAAAWDRNADMNIYLEASGLQREGTRSHLQNLGVSPNGFAALVAWLRARRCSVSYEIQGDNASS